MKRPIVIINVILILALIAGGYFLWWPSLQNFINLRAELKVKEQEVVQKQEYYAKLNDTFNKLVSYSDSLSKIDSVLPESISMPSLFVYLQAVSSQSGLILGPLSLPSASSSTQNSNQQLTTTGAAKVLLPISVSGSYSALKNFLNVIYKNSRMIEVDTLGFGSPEKGDQFEFRVGLRTHYYTTQQAVNSAEISQ